MALLGCENNGPVRNEPPSTAVKCAQTAVVYNNPGPSKMCVTVNFSDACPKEDSEVTITGHNGSTPIPDGSDETLSMRIDVGQSLKFTCKGTPTDNPNDCCAYTKYDKHVDIAKETCREGFPPKWD